MRSERQHGGSARRLSERCSRHALTSHRRGMTLFEAIISLGLAVALLGAAFFFLANLLDSRERAREHARRHASATALLDRLESDLVMAVAGDAALGGGVTGDSTSLRILTRGVLLRLDDSRATLSDLVRHEYRFNPATRRIDATRAGARAGTGGGAAITHTFEGEVARLRYRYYDGSGWSDAFDSLAQGGLPVAIEVSIWYPLPPGAESGVEDGLGGDASVEDSFALGADESDLGEGAQPRSRVEFDVGSSSDDGPPPDRRLVIAVPDARGPSSESPAEAAGDDALSLAARAPFDEVDGADDEEER